MSLQSEQVIGTIGDKTVTLQDVLNNLKVLDVNIEDIKVSYILTRINKSMPWPAPYEAGQQFDGEPYHCCSYSTLDENDYPEDTKKLNVYRIED